MRNEPAWLPLDVIIETNQAEVRETNEPFLLRDRGLLESAWARPVNHWHYGEDDIVRLATALLVGIAQNHAFEQGNKRTAVTSAVMFIEINGYQWTMPNNELLGLVTEAAATKKIGEDHFAELIRPYLMPL